MNILAINEGINSSVVAAANGSILFALQEERINRIKEYHGFPHQALDFTLDFLNLKPADISAVCLSNLHSPHLKKAEFLQMYENRIKPGYLPSNQRIFKNLLKKIAPGAILKTRQGNRHGNLNRKIEQELKSHGFENSKIIRTHHQLNHAAAAYFGCRKNPRDAHLVLSLDGGGDHDCAHVYRAEQGRLELVASTPNGHSLGNIYAIATQVMGMTPHEHEYKLMGLAAYTLPKYTQPIFEKFKNYLDLDPHNPLVFRRKTAIPTYELQQKMVNDCRLTRFDNFAGGLQRFTEDLLCRWIAACIKQTGIKKIVAAGGVFMNVKANKLIAEMQEVEYFDVFPSGGDESLPFGAAWHFFSQNQPEKQEALKLEHYYFGPDPSYDWQEVYQELLSTNQYIITELKKGDPKIAVLLAAGEVIARCCGRMEFGARALGNRSILADPANYSVVPVINKMIKKRDFWMPFAPIILREQAEKYLHIPPSLPPERISPYMVHSFDTRNNRSDFIAGIHQQDLTSRAQIIQQEINPGMYELLQQFSALTGRGVLLNTSFNLHGFPIVMGTRDALEVFTNSELKNLLINNFLIQKKG